ncbi:MAG TPA: helix-turn-helix domain-containing protein [Candidatus Dormibacteraeota bacterium]|nr:helix-turn-helix domain-containing protein [Candidatus Dormibacteraeota bacterium]
MDSSCFPSYTRSRSGYARTRSGSSYWSSPTRWRSDLTRRGRILARGSDEEEVVGILAGEGLLQVEGSDGEPVVHPLSAVPPQRSLRYSMPARIFREALRRLREREGASRMVHRSSLRRPERREAVVALGSGRGDARVPLTEIEERILDRLLSSPGSLVGTDELAVAVWGPPPNERSRQLWHDRLKRRLTGLRRKLAPYLSGEPIVNVYGWGYRLSAPDRIVLRS